MLSVNLIELVWVTVNLVAVGVVIYNLAAVLREKADYEALSLGSERSAREIAAIGNVRREWLRLIKQLLLLTVVVPSLFRAGDVVFVFDPAKLVETFSSLVVLALIAVPFVMLYGSVSDARDRQALASFSLEDLIVERDGTDLRIKKALAKLGERADTNEDKQNEQDGRLDVLEEKAPPP